jgi:hypothetical protein
MSKLSDTSLVQYIPNGAPAFDPELYNLIPRMFNCYAYALRLSEQGWAHAGQIREEVATGDIDEKRKLTPNKLNSLLESDGLARILEHGLVSDDRHIIASYINKGKGYHFFSLDRGNVWSHKSGELTVERLEKPISLPVVGQKSGAFEFTGFFAVPKTGISYYPRLSNHLKFTP